jgi:hypothetical protein
VSLAVALVALAVLLLVLFVLVRRRHSRLAQLDVLETTVEVAMNVVSLASDALD